MALIAAGFEAEPLDEDGDRVYRKGKLSVFYYGEDKEFSLYHLHPFDFVLTDMKQILGIDEVLNAVGLKHTEPINN